MEHENELLEAFVEKARKGEGKGGGPLGRLPLQGGADPPPNTHTHRPPSATPLYHQSVLLPVTHLHHSMRLLPGRSRLR